LTNGPKAPLVRFDNSREQSHITQISAQQQHNAMEQLGWSVVHKFARAMLRYFALSLYRDNATLYEKQGTNQIFMSRQQGDGTQLEIWGASTRSGVMAMRESYFR
jgi:hypothetical protein